MDTLHTHLQGPLVVLQGFLRVLQVAVQMVCDRERNPVLPEVWTGADNRQARLHERIVVPELRLQLRGIAEQVEVLLRGCQRADRTHRAGHAPYRT